MTRSNRLVAIVMFAALSALLGAMSGCAPGISDDEGADAAIVTDPNPITPDPTACGSCANGTTCCNVGAAKVCVDTSRDRNNCGGCGEVCTTASSDSCRFGDCQCNGGPACAAGSNCCGGAAGGCKNFNSDPLNCGGCGKACAAGLACSNGQCVCGGANPRTCTASETCCGSAGCLDTMNDANNCGGCGIVCPTVGGRQLICSAGQCLCGAGGNACPGPNGSGFPTKLSCCGNKCADLCSDMTACGSCGTSCLPGGLDQCLQGTCILGSIFDPNPPQPPAECSALPLP